MTLCSQVPVDSKELHIYAIFVLVGRDPGKVFTRQLPQLQIQSVIEKRQTASKSMLQVRLELTTSALLNRYCHISTAR